MECLRCCGNIFWLIPAGLITSFVCFVVGIILCITIVGIPLGLQFFKIAKYSLWPFGNMFVLNYEKYKVANTIYIIFVGWWLFLFMLFISMFYFISICGIPFGVKLLQVAKLLFCPFGAEMMKVDDHKKSKEDGDKEAPDNESEPQDNMKSPENAEV